MSLGCKIIFIIHLLCYMQEKEIWNDMSNSFALFQPCDIITCQFIHN